MKKFILIIIIFLVIILLFLGFVKYNKKTNQVAVLVYHNIVLEQEKNEDPDSLTIQKFKEQMKYLKENGYTFISAQELYDWKEKKIEIPSKSVLITFDDGYYSFKYLVEPVLEELNIKAICFLIGNSTPETTPNYEAKAYGTIGKDEIEDNPQNVEYGSHTFGLHGYNQNQEKLIEVSTIDELEHDIKLFNENVFEAEFLAYPFYTYTSDMIKKLSEYNYKLAFCGEEEMVTIGCNNYKIPRISGVRDIEEFKKIFETDNYKNKYGNGIIRKICVNIERRLLKSKN